MIDRSQDSERQPASLMPIVTVLGSVEELTLGSSNRASDTGAGMMGANSGRALDEVDLPARD